MFIVSFPERKTRCFEVHATSVSFKMTTSKDCPMLVLLSIKLYTKARIRERERKREKKQISFQRPSDIKIKDVKKNSLCFTIAAKYLQSMKKNIYKSKDKIQRKRGRKKTSR